MPTPRRSPSRRDLKSIILWAGRMLASEDGKSPYPDPIRVKIEKTDDAEAVTVEPKRGLDGMTAPEGLEREPEADVSVSELLRVLFSQDERVLLADLIDNEPCQATDVMDRCRSRIKRSAFWDLWGNLQQRAVVEQDDDNRYRVGPKWVREVVGKGGGGGERPAA